VYAVTRTAAHQGVDSYLVQVEASISSGLPVFLIVGLPDAAVREGAERVRSAVRLAGVRYDVQPQLPPDVLGVFVLLPQAM